MEVILYLIIFIVVNGLLSDIMCRFIGYLYVKHSDLLTNEKVWLRSAYLKRFSLLYGLNSLVVVLFYTADINPIVFLSKLCVLLLLNMVIVSDYEQRLIFDRILVAIVTIVMVSGGGMDISLLSSLGGGIVGGGAMLLLAVLMRGTLGGGDIKLVIALGVWQGIYNIGGILTNGFLIGGVAALLLLVTRLKKRTDYFAYGPYFVYGAWINIL